LKSVKLHFYKKGSERAKSTVFKDFAFLNGFDFDNGTFEKCEIALLRFFKSAKLHFWFLKVRFTKKGRLLSRDSGTGNGTGVP